MTILYLISLIGYEATNVIHYFLGIGDILLTIYGLIPLFLIDLIYGVLIMILFVKRLRLLLKGMNNDPNANQTTVRAQKQKYNDLVIKLTILTSTAIVSTVLLFTLYSAFYQIVTSVFIDIFFNSLCLVLSFKDFTNEYNILCHCCTKMKCCRIDKTDAKLSGFDSSNYEMKPNYHEEWKKRNMKHKIDTNTNNIDTNTNIDNHTDTPNDNNSPQSSDNIPKDDIPEEIP